MASRTFWSRAAYREAIKTLVLERPGISSLPDFPEFPGASGESWANIIAAWFDANRINPPSKVAVANWLVENSKAELSAEGRTLLSQAHAELLRALEQLPPTG